MDYKTSINLINILETSISYSNQLKAMIMRNTEDTSDANYRVVKFDYDKLTDHIDKCCEEIEKLKNDQRNKWLSIYE